MEALLTYALAWFAWLAIGVITLEIDNTEHTNPLQPIAVILLWPLVLIRIIIKKVVSKCTKSTH